MVYPALARTHVSPANKPCYTANHDVRVRRQDTIVETVKLIDEYDKFTQQNFPQFQTRFYQVPEVFSMKVKDPSKVVEGFPSLPADEPPHKIWKTHGLGELAEGDVHQAVQEELRGRPAISWNSFKQRSLFLIAKQTFKEDRDIKRQQEPDMLEHPLTEDETSLFQAIGHDLNHLRVTVDSVIEYIFQGQENASNTLDLALALEKLLKTDLAKTKDIEVCCKNLLRKIRNPSNPLNPGKTEVDNYLMFNLWNRMMEKDQEFDQLVLEKLSSLFLHLEVKSVDRQEGNKKEKGLKSQFIEACKQLEAGKKMFLNIIAPACKLSQNWAYQGMVCFPNVSDRSHFSSWGLSEEEMKMIITKEELLTGGWLDSVKMINNEATDEEYKNLVALICGSGFVSYSTQDYTDKDETVARIIGGEKGGVGGEKITLQGPPSFQDLLGRHLGSIQNILFWTREQLNLFERILENYHIILWGPYGGGKTVLLVSAALTEADNPDNEVIFIIGAAHNDDGKHAKEDYILDIAIKEKLSNSNIRVKSLTDIRRELELPVTARFHEIIPQFLDSLETTGNTKIFIDEVPVSKDDMMKMSSNEESSLSRTLSCIAKKSVKSVLAIRTGDTHDIKTGGIKYPTKDEMSHYMNTRTGHTIVELTLTMRSSSSIQNTCHNIKKYSSYSALTTAAVSILAEPRPSPSTVQGSKPHIIMSPWSSITADYAIIEAGIARALNTNTVPGNTAIICDCKIEPSAVFNIVRKKCPSYLYTGGVQEYDHYGDPTYSDLTSDERNQERTGAISWYHSGGILVTHTHLFVGMEAHCIIWITQRMGDQVLARSNIMRAVGRLFIVTDSEYAMTSAVKKYCSVETI